jgi:glutamate racemase
VSNTGIVARGGKRETTLNSTNRIGKHTVQSNRILRLVNIIIRFYYTLMIKAGPVAFFDSGIGGLPYFQWVRDHLPDASFTYLADRKNFPYGEKPIQLLITLILSTMEKYIARVNPSMVVVACNTASVSALQPLRDHFSVPFVGVVPAIKPAAAGSRKKAIGLLATMRTIEDPYTDNLVRLFADGYHVQRFAGVDIIDFVENRLMDASDEDIMEVIAPAVRFFNNKEVDTLVLGCTHFLHIKDAIARSFKGSVEIVDSLEGVGRQVIRMWNTCCKPESGEATMPIHKHSDVFYLNGETENDSIYRRFAESCGLKWGGVL